MNMTKVDGFTTITRQILYSNKLTPGAKVAAAAISDHLLATTGEQSIDLEQLARVLDRRPSTVIGYLLELASVGMLVGSRRCADCGKPHFRIPAITGQVTIPDTLPPNWTG